MKTARFVLKIVGAALTFAGAVCLVIGYWDKIAGLFAAKPALDEGEEILGVGA